VGLAARSWLISRQLLLRHQCARSPSSRRMWWRWSSATVASVGAAVLSLLRRSAARKRRRRGRILPSREVASGVSPRDSLDRLCGHRESRACRLPCTTPGRPRRVVGTSAGLTGLEREEVACRGGARAPGHCVFGAEGLNLPRYWLRPTTRHSYPSSPATARRASPGGIIRPPVRATAREHRQRAASLCIAPICRRRRGKWLPCGERTGSNGPALVSP
jgi:hypothetical protein